MYFYVVCRGAGVRTTKADRRGQHLSDSVKADQQGRMIVAAIGLRNPGWAVRNTRWVLGSQASIQPGEGNSHQTLYWQTSSDGGLLWTEPTRILPDMTPPGGGEPLPVWSPVLHTQVNLAFKAILWKAS